MLVGKMKYLMLGAVAVAALALGGTLLAHRQAKSSDPVTLSEGTALHVRLSQTLTSDQARSGQTFEATVTDPVVVSQQTVIPQGTRVQGRVVDVEQGGHLKGVARIRLRLTEIEMGGGGYELHTSSIVRRSGNHNVRNVSWIGGGAGGGAIIGALAGGGKGALIGAPVGAGAGTLVAYLTGKRHVRLPAETPLTFRLTQPLTVNMRS